ncbi:MAG: SagB/ThcOx family dehydrogenase [Candidatus Omnitrophota bacterium]|nr:SagB/ThcOx family dehydrogenase [Candidatus Omnitrophota bacterium]
MVKRKIIIPFGLTLIFLVLSALAALGICAEEKQVRKVTLDPYLGQRFYESTKLIPDQERSSPLATYRKPELYKLYPQAKKISLPPADFNGISLEETIKKRRSKRQDDVFSDKPVSLKELSQLLFSASGITGSNRGLELRASPSAGALYPIEIYLMANNVLGLDEGVYHYSVSGHNLELLKAGDFRDRIAHAVMNQPGVKESAVVFIFSAIPGRTTSKYDLRGWRYVYMEVGYVSENIYLEATSLGLSTTAMSAFYDDELNNLLDLNGKDEMALHVQILGRKNE